MDSEGIGPAGKRFGSGPIEGVGPISRADELAVRRLERPPIKTQPSEHDIQAQRIAELEKQVAELETVGSLLKAIIEHNAAEIPGVQQVRFVRNNGEDNCSLVYDTLSHEPLIGVHIVCTNGRTAIHSSCLPETVYVLEGDSLDIFVTKG